MMSSLMPSLIELLQQAQKELTCPTCGRSFLIPEIRPRGHVNNTIMLQAVCSNNHFPIVLIFIPSKPFTEKIEPIRRQDITSLKKTLDTFEGDFHDLWKKGKKAPN
jgi:hypothetical protein